MAESGGSIASERSLPLSEDTADESACVLWAVAKVPLVNARFDRVEEVGRYITLLAGEQSVSIEHLQVVA